MQDSHVYLNGHLARGIVCARQAGIARSISYKGVVMTHQEIFDYALAVYNVALGVDEIIHIVSNNLNVDHFVSNQYPS